MDFNKLLENIKTEIGKDNYIIYLILLYNARLSNKSDQNHFIVSSSFINKYLNRVVYKKEIVLILDVLLKKSIKIVEIENEQKEWVFSLLGSWIIETENSTGNEFKIKYYLSEKMSGLINSILEKMILDV